MLSWGAVEWRETLDRGQGDAAASSATMRFLSFTKSYPRKDPIPFLWMRTQLGSELRIITSRKHNVRHAVGECAALRAGKRDWGGRRGAWHNYLLSECFCLLILPRSEGKSDPLLRYSFRRFLVGLCLKDNDKVVQRRVNNSLFDRKRNFRKF